MAGERISCDHCGEMIVGEFWLLDGDGQRVEESHRPAAFTLHPECLEPWRVDQEG